MRLKTPAALPLRPLILAALLSGSAAAWAQAMPGEGSVEDQLDRLAALSLEQLLEVEVYGASKRAQRTSDAPASVSVLTAEDFRTYGWRTLADALRSLRGFYVSYDRAYSYIGARGFQRPSDYNTRILLLIDGYRVNDNVYDAAVAGNEFPLDVELIERMEIIRGPASSVYGGNAFFGIINVVTKSGTAIGGLEVSGSAGSFDSYGAQARFGRALANGAALLLSASRYDSAGDKLSFPDDPVTRGRPIADTDEESYQRFFAKLEYEGLRVDVGHGDREKGTTAGLWGVPVDPLNRVEDAQSWIDAAYTHAVGTAEVTGRLTYSQYRFNGDYVYPPLNRDESRGDWWGAELKTVSKLGERHTVVAGIEYQDNFKQHQTNFDISPFFVYLDDKRDSTRLGIFAQDDFAVTDRLTVSAGLRFDDYSEDESQLNPRLGIIYAYSPDTTWKALYGTAFRPANVYEKYYADGFIVTQNPDLKSENITTYELVLETRVSDTTWFSAAAFHYEIDDLIDYGTDPVSGLDQFQNVARAQADGLELEASHAFTGGAKLRISYTLQTTEDDTGVALTNSPRRLAKLNFSVPLLSNSATLGWETQYQSERKTDLGYAGGYAISNLTLTTQRTSRRWALSASLYNLFDKDYSDPADAELTSSRGLIAQDGRSWRLNAAYRF